MLPKWLKKILPNRNEVANHKNLAWLGTRLHDPNLWHLTRHSVSVGVAAGLFIAFIPLPGQMIMAALTCVLVRGNLLLAAACTWVTNPITFVPINYFTYAVGSYITGGSNGFIIPQSFSWEWLKTVGKPFFIGLPIVAVGASLTGYIVIHLILAITAKKTK